MISLGTHGYLWLNKSLIFFSCFKQFYADLETHFGKFIQTIEVDNTLE